MTTLSNSPPDSAFFFAAALLCAIPMLAKAECETALTQTAMNQCLDSEYRKSQAMLDTLITDYQQRLTPQQLALFRKTQGDWEAYRKSACEFDTSSVQEASMYSLTMAVCLNSKTHERIFELKALSSCQEGDALCPARPSGNPPHAN